MSGAPVPSKRAWVIFTDGATAGNVSVSSTVGVNMPVPSRLTRQTTRAEVVVALIVELASSPHLMSLEPARRHMWVVPIGLIAFSCAVIVPGPSLVNVKNRGHRRWTAFADRA